MGIICCRQSFSINDIWHKKANYREISGGMQHEASIALNNLINFIIFISILCDMDCLHDGELAGAQPPAAPCDPQRLVQTVLWSPEFLHNAGEIESARVGNAELY